MPTHEIRRIPRIFRSAIRPMLRIAQLESASGVLLLMAALGALLWANLDPQSYQRAFTLPFTVGAGNMEASFSLRQVINHGLMAIFFFVVGMEIKRELVVGELNTRAKASLPLIAAAAGMLVPALFFLACTHGRPDVVGWAIPTATDIAFCLGILALLSGRVPRSLAVFVTTLAIFDDIGGILVIAFFYAGGLDAAWLGLAVALSAALFLMGHLQVTNAAAYALVGIALWVAFHEGGIHATIAGVVLGLAIPARHRIPPRAIFQGLSDHVALLLRDDPDKDLDHAQVLQIEQRLEGLVTPVQRFTHALHPFVSFGVMPVFALANSGVQLTGLTPDSLTAPVTLGVTIGLLFGKPIGILLATIAAVRMGWSPMPAGATLGQLLGVSVLAGVGFTVALFIAGLAYPGAPNLLDQAKLGILAGSCAAGVLGYVLLRFMTGKPVAVGR